MHDSCSLAARYLDSVYAPLRAGRFFTDWEPIRVPLPARDLDVFVSWGEPYLSPICPGVKQFLHPPHPLHGPL